MAVTVADMGEVKVVAPAVPLDREGLESFQEALVPLLAAARPLVVVDLSRCPRVTSEALRCFLAVARRVDRQGGGFALCGARDEVARALHLGGVAQLCRVLATVDEAVEAFTSRDELRALAELVAELLARGEARAVAAGAQQ